MIETRRPGLAVGLFLLAPLVGEYLLGNTPITQPESLLGLAPMYGGGALLIREVTRRTGRGWPTMVALAAAYALLEEGPIDMMLWNPSYGGFSIADAYAETYVPVLGTSVQLLQDVLTMHTVWSICVPIAVMETFAGDRTRPWLGRGGLAATALVFVTGSAALAALQIAQNRFVASPAELAWSFAAIAGLVVLGLRLGRDQAERDGEAPAPWAVGSVAFGLTGLYWSREFLPETTPQWPVAVGWCLLAAAGIALGRHWSRGRGWGGQHRLALAGGALATYVWVGYFHARQMELPPTTAVLGTLVGGLATLALLAAAFRALRNRPAA